MTTSSTQYTIGTPGKPWENTEKQAWLSAQAIRRSYQQEVLSKFDTLPSGFVQNHYGNLAVVMNNTTKEYPLYAYTSEHWDNNKPTVLVTGGVHGYETSGVQGAIAFLLDHANAYSQFNFIVVPCVSPWGYETINRWNYLAVDPNRSFYKNSNSQEATMLMEFVASLNIELLAHFDLHETTDTDNSEFRPALAARDGIQLHDWGIPDGFYTVANTPKPELPFQQAIINSVKQVTHIAPADDESKIIGADVVSEGVICYDKASLHLCGGFTGAPFVTTTEVYPDSPSASAEICIAAQVAAIRGGLNYIKEQVL
ncbi:MAG: M14 family metallocarboxypeptidase [Glaciecola sp.]